LDSDNNLEEGTNMTRKAFLFFAAVVVAVLFSFTTFAQDQGQESAAKAGEKTIASGDLQAQKKIIEGLQASYAQAQAEYNAECTEKSYKSIEDYKNNYEKKCQQKHAQLTNIYSELKKGIEAYNKNVEQHKANNAQKSPEAIDSSPQSKGK
jgi:hypothetical protein